MVSIIERDKLNLSIDYNDYLSFMNEDTISKNRWYGVSIQYVKNKHGFCESEQLLSIQNVFRKVVAQCYNHTWIVMYEYKDFKWFNSKNEADSFPVLKKIFGIDKNGVLCCDQKKLLKLSNEIVCYPYLLNRQDIVCVNDEDGLIIKLNNHLSVDVISVIPITEKIEKIATDIEALRLINYNTTQ